MKFSLQVLLTKMEFCGVKCVFIVYTVTVISAFPSKQEASTEMILTTTSTPPPLHIVEMGQGLQEMPQGHPLTKSINFAYNHLSNLEDSVFYNKSYRALHKIELFQNKINDMGVLAFKGLKHLKTVDLSENNLSTINAYTFEFNTRLEKLDLAGNKISFSRDAHFLVSSSMLTLILTNNRVENIFAFSFVGLPKLRNLMLDYNIITYIEPNSFKPMSDLQYLCLANTGVHKLSTNMFGSAPRIIDLTNTILANKFSPPLRRIKNEAVGKLLNIDLYL